MKEQPQSMILVEDSPDDEAMSLRAIHGSGIPCEVSVARSGREALELLISPQSPTPDLIVLDFHLPGQTGLQILRELRRSHRTRHVPVVMLSAMESEPEIAECMAEGANSFVSKPKDPTQYFEHIALIVRYWLTVNRSQPKP